MPFNVLAWLKRRLHWGSTHAGDGGIFFEGGSGDTVDSAIIIRGAQADLIGTYAEFAWLAQVYGQKDRDWRLISHSHGVQRGRDIDTFVLRLQDGTSRTVYFDCTESFGKPLPTSSDD
ncbi:MAG TPA: hypothetical protein VKB58_08170 [Terriglobales bacterium]|jgi:hypothetical protein|nr:hypothetical protein [Terriglobales bacterium]